jgi:hypothetical protein
MTNFAELLPAVDSSGPPPDRLRFAVAAYLARFTGLSRTHALWWGASSLAFTRGVRVRC